MMMAHDTLSQDVFRLTFSHDFHGKKKLKLHICYCRDEYSVEKRYLWIRV